MSQKISAATKVELPIITMTVVKSFSGEMSWLVEVAMDTTMTARTAVGLSCGRATTPPN